MLMMAFGRRVFPVDAHVGRVLSRVHPYESLGLDLRGCSQKVRQRLLAELIPPDVRKRLHINLIVLGRTTCTPARPRCDHCPIATWCLTGGLALTPSVAVEVAA